MKEVELTSMNHSIRSTAINPLRLHPPTLPHLGPPLHLRRRLPRHSPPSRQAETLQPAPLPDTRPERPLSGERVCEVCVAVWDIVGAGDGGAAVGDGVVCFGRGVAVAD